VRIRVIYSFMKLSLLLLTPLVLAASHSVRAADQILKINGSTTVNLAAAEAAENLRADKKLNIQIDTQGGSSGGISQVGEGLTQIGMISKPLTDEDRAKYPKCNYTVTEIGADAVALIVSKDVWDGGVHAIDKQQARDIYEGKVKNWKQLSGKEQRIAFFNKEPGRGTWEVFANWAYGDHKKAPEVSFPEVGGNEETRNKVSSTRGALSQLSASWADGKTVFALALKDDATGKVVEPTSANVANHTYAMSRPLSLITNGAPAGDVKVFVNYMLGEKGQALMAKNGYLTMKELKGEPPAATAK
jgi:phosphate transport system substrate-binding protein